MSDQDEEQKKTDEKIESGVSYVDLLSKSIDVLGAATNNEHLAEYAEKGAAVTALPGDTLKTGKGLEELRDGKPGGVADTVAGGAGIAGDAATLAGMKPVATVAGMAKGVTELTDSSKKFAEGMQNDNGIQEAQAIRGFLDGIADTAGAAPGSNPTTAAIGKTGKALGYGLALGDKIAPVMFGKNTDGSSDVQESDGTYVPSTGNRYVDWVVGKGEWTNSRFHADGLTEQERASPTMGSVAGGAMSAALQANLAKLDEAIANASSDDERQQLMDKRTKYVAMMSGN
jgi:hypothetical protein